MLAPGARLQGRYTIQAVLGQGGMGVVYRARHDILHTDVAIKVLRVSEAAIREQAYHLFQKEARVLARLQHPNIVRVSDCFEEGGHVCLVMDLVDGESLESRLASAPDGLPVGEVVSWILATCDALAFLHGQDPPLIHRDLKPGNLMIDRSGRVMIVDFGIARALGSNVATSTLLALTPGYAPVEQYGTGVVGPLADIYSLGATFYTLVTHDTPPPSVDRMSGEAVMRPPSLLNSAVSPEVEQVLLRMMAVAKADRYQAAADVRAALEAAVMIAWPPATGPAQEAEHGTEGIGLRTVLLEEAAAPRSSTTGTPSGPTLTGSGASPRPLDRQSTVLPTQVTVRAERDTDSLPSPTSASEPAVGSSPSWWSSGLALVAVLLVVAAVLTGRWRAPGPGTGGSPLASSPVPASATSPGVASPGVLTGRDPGRGVGGSPLASSPVPVSATSPGVASPGVLTGRGRDPGAVAGGSPSASSTVLASATSPGVASPGVVTGRWRDPGAVTGGSPSASSPVPVSATSPRVVSPRVIAMRNPRDGMLLVRVSGGTFTMGSDRGEGIERPPHSVTVVTFYLGRTEVTNAQFRAFVAATSYSAGSEWKACADRWGEQAPVVCVNWHDAGAYCRWAGLRLPTEAEWEYAARGPRGLEWPWGERFDPSFCCTSTVERRNGPAAVGSYPAGASPFGCLDMIGNAWEWTSTMFRPYPSRATDGREDPAGTDNRVLRGGSWNIIGARYVRPTVRYSTHPSVRGDAFGFRCARSVSE